MGHVFKGPQWGRGITVRSLQDSVTQAKLSSVRGSTAHSKLLRWGKVVEIPSRLLGNILKMSLVNVDYFTGFPMLIW